MISGLIFLGLLVVLVMWAVGIYNGLIRGRRGYENAFAQIDVQLTRRYDLIPNLVEVAKGYMAHERDTLEAVITARNQAVSGLKNAQANPGDAAAMQALSGAEGQLTGALGRLFALSEAYPDLKANQNVLKLQGAINETEEQLSASRRAFNAAVTIFNNSVEVFPSNILAAMMGFRRRTLFEIPESQKARPDVSPVTSSR